MLCRMFEKEILGEKVRGGGGRRGEGGGGRKYFFFFLQDDCERKNDRKAAFRPRNWAILFRLRSKGFPYQDSIGGARCRWKEEAKRLQDQA